MSWDQQSLVNSFSSMALQLPHNSVNDWVADSGASHHTTHSVGNTSNPRPLNSASPSSIVVGNGSTPPVTLVGDSVIPGPFYLNNFLLAPDIVQNLLSVRRFTTDNFCSMEFDPFGLSVKDLTTRNLISRSNSTSPLYMLRLRVPPLPAVTHRVPCLLLLRLVFWLLSPHLHGTVVLATLALTPYLAYLGHPLFPALVLLMIFVMLVSWANTPDCLFPVHRVMRKKPLITTSSVISVSGSKYYLVILDDVTHYLWTFPLKQKSDTFTTLSNFFCLCCYSVELHYQSYTMRQRTWV
jgi:hypothetical protein